MSFGTRIESAQNATYKALKRRVDNREHDAVIVEGWRELTRALDAGRTLTAIYICEDFWTEAIRASAQNLFDMCRHKSVPVYALTAPLFQKISYREHPDGILGLVAPWRTQLEDLKFKRAPFVCIAEGIEKPGNLGALLRTVDGCGADALILCDSRVDLFNPNVVRASQGAIFSLPIVNTNNADAYAYLERHNIVLIAATPSAQKFYWEVDYAQPTAIVLGSEHDGITSFWLERCLGVKIPMLGLSDSLNVNVAGAIILYEAVRQRAM